VIDQGTARRCLVVSAILLGVAVFLKTRTLIERVPPRLEFAAFPAKVAGWEGRELPIDAETREMLGTGDFLSRSYSGQGQSNIELFMAYFPSQRTGNTIHSPKNCLPGSGWTPMKSSQVEVRTADRGSAVVNRYIVVKGSEQDVVLYWYQAHGRIIPSEFSAKIHLVMDALRMNRTDGSLVRVIAPVAGNESIASAESRAVSFAQALLPQLDPYIPR